MGALLAAALLLAPTAALAGEQATPKTRHRFPGWDFSLLMFENWAIVPIETKGEKGPKDPANRWLVGRFFERGADVDRYVEHGITYRGLAEVHAIRRVDDESRDASMAQVLRASAKAWRMTLPKATFDDAKDVKTKDGIPGKRYWYAEKDGRQAVFGVWEKDDVSVGVMVLLDVFNVRTHGLGCDRVITSLLWTDDSAKSADKPNPALEGLPLTPERRKEIERGLVKGWSILVSPKKQYLVVYNSKKGKNDKLARTLAERLEAIRAQCYEREFPPAAPIASISIVRICGDDVEYRQYGGPSGTAGYWSYDAQELAFYDASPGRAVDDDTLATLYHEGFHQYVYYAVGRVSPHPWFNEGHGDYYAGARFDGKTFAIRPFSWRVQRVLSAVANGDRTLGQVDGEDDVDRDRRKQRGFAPLRDLIRYDKAAYYKTPSVCYAQGWSLVYFLREVAPKNPDLPASWAQILPTYFRVLKEEVAAASAAPTGTETPAPGGEAPAPGGEAPAPAEGETPTGIPVARDLGTSKAALEKARATAFEGVDLEALQTAWIEFVRSLERTKPR